MNLVSIVKYSIMELKNLFLYPLVEKYKITNYEKYWIDREGSSTNKLKNKDMTPNTFMVQRSKILKKEIKKIFSNNTLSLFDFGSGDGRQLLEIKNSDVKFSKIVASDISNYSIKLLSNYFITIDLSQNEINNIETGQYDVVSAFEVLEHLPNCEIQLKELLRISNSLLVFSVPNTGFIMHRLRLLFGKFPLQWRSSPGEHLRFWTSSDMYWWLTNILNLSPNDFKIYHYAGFPILSNLLFMQPILCKGIFVVIYK